MNSVMIGHLALLVAIMGGLRVRVHLKPKNGKGRFWERMELHFEFMGRKLGGE